MVAPKSKRIRNIKFSILLKDWSIKFLLFNLIVALLLNTAACLKRVPIPLDTQEVENHAIIIVHLKFDNIEYKVKNPKFQGEYLTGLSSNQKIKILLKDVKSIEIEKPDKKKFIISYVLIIGTLAVFAILLYPYAGFENLD